MVLPEGLSSLQAPRELSWRSSAVHAMNPKTEVGLFVNHAFKAKSTELICAEQAKKRPPPFYTLAL
jgi:hypothetical protein